jgi:hypothetical protein
MIDDAKLIAFVNDELDAPARAEVEDALSDDPLLAARLARRLQAKRREAASDEPVRRGGAGGGAATVVRLADRRKAQRRRPHRPFAWPSWTPVAISLVVGVAGGVLLTQGASGPLAADADGALTARGDLAEALERQPAGIPGATRIGASFRAAEGFCRTFAIDARGLAGIACKAGGRWRAAMVERFAPGTDEPAAVPTIVAAAAGKMRVGEPLDRAAEDLARARRWKS